MAVLGAQHGGHLAQVGGVALLVHAAGEGDGDDPLSDVDQVQLVALVQRLQQADAPVGGRHSGSLLGSDGVERQTGGAAVDSEKLIP